MDHSNYYFDYINSTDGSDTGNLLFGLFLKASSQYFFYKELSTIEAVLTFARKSLILLQREVVENGKPYKMRSQTYKSVYVHVYNLTKPNVYPKRSHSSGRFSSSLYGCKK